MTNLFTTSSLHRRILQHLFFTILSLSISTVKAQLTVHFGYCSATLTNTEKEKIKNYISCDNKSVTISIGGHTGNTKGREAANKILSEKRANAVADFIRSLPCDISVDSVIGFGGTQTLSAIKSKAANRRAEITMHTDEPIATNAPYDADADMGKARFAALYQQLATPPQSFCISPNRDTMLVSEKGTIIQIKKGDLSISECSCVTILLNEYFDKSEMILNNLTTTSDGKQLESGGMIKIEAVCNGKLVPMASGHSIGIMVPTDTVLPGMKLFTAKRDSASEILNWSTWLQNPNFDTMNYWRMRGWCGGTGPTDKYKCPFFFCGLSNFIKHPFGLKRWQRQQYLKLLAPEERLVKKYGFDTAALKKALEKSKINKPELLRYYVFQNTEWGYKNCDRYQPGTITNSLYVNESPKGNIDTKFAESKTKSIIPGSPRVHDYEVSKIATQQPGWAIAIKLAESKIFLSMKPCNSSDGSTIPEYREVTLAQLRQNILLVDAK